MANQASPEAIVAWAEGKAQPNCKVKAKRLTQTEVGLLLQLHKDGLTQVEIAHRLGITQQSVNQWIQNLTDTTQPAKLYLRGSALHMAKNIVHKGLARDHVAALKGLGVLEEQQTQGINIQINGLILSGLPQDVVVGPKQDSIEAVSVVSRDESSD